MKYLMFVCTDPFADPEETSDGTLEVDDWAAKYDASGQRVIGERVRPLEDATSVRRVGGKVMVSDGPYAETKDWIGGFDVLDCADLDEVIAIAAEHPMAAGGRLEIRPFWVDEE